VNLHSRAKSCPASRALFVQRALSGMPVAQASELAGFSKQTGYKWLRRFRQDGALGLRDRSSRPQRLPRCREEGLVAEAIGLRRTGLTAVVIARRTGIPRSTLGAWLRRAGISRPASLQQKEPPRRYEHPFPGDLLHLDTKKLANFHRIGHRKTGDRHHQCEGVGYQVLHVAIDDHSRTTYMEILPDEQKETTCGFLQRAVAHYRAAYGITVRKLLTDNGPAYKSKVFAKTAEALELRHGRTRPYRPRTNGKAERLIQTALREWAYGPTWLTSEQRNQALEAWLHYYNHHRPHSALGGRPPDSRVNNLSGTDI
jgi:transposase InsO family protein